MAPRKPRGDAVAQEQGRRLALAREAKGRALGRELTQQELVDTVNRGPVQGLTVAAYGSYERGRHRVPHEWVRSIAAALDVSPWYIVDLPEPEPLKHQVRYICDQANRIQSDDILDFIVKVVVDQRRRDEEWRDRLGPPPAPAAAGPPSPKP